jgi:hypothetical protein
VINKENKRKIIILVSIVDDCYIKVIKIKLLDINIYI